MTDDSLLYDQFEPYGKLFIDIGNRAENQNITLWNLPAEEYLKAPMNETTISSNHTFQESKTFLNDDNTLILRGEVMESDKYDETSSGDDVIVKYSGNQFRITEFKDGIDFDGKQTNVKNTVDEIETTFTMIIVKVK